MNNLKILITQLLENGEFGMIPYNPTSSANEKFLFNFFKNLKVDLLSRELLKIYKDYNHSQIKNALSLISHYKNGLVVNTLDDIELDFFLTFKEFFNKKYINHLLFLLRKDLLKLNKYYELLPILERLYIDDFDSYLIVTSKININGTIIKIFNKDQSKVFEWLNHRTDLYKQLKELNQPLFILQNINTNLIINNDSLKYFFEVCPIDLALFKELKQNLGIQTIWKYSSKRISIDFLIELIDSIDDIIFILQICSKLSTIEKLFKILEDRFPYVYNNLHFLLLMKKELS